MKRTKLLILTNFLCVLILLNSASNITGVVFVETSLEFSGNTIAFDIYHGGYHANDVDNLVANLTAAGNIVTFINETWDLPDNVDALILTSADIVNWTTTEIADIVNWMALGNRLLWVSGDSDYSGFFDPTPINDILSAIGAIVRLDGTSISDPVFNDGASYRVAATEFGVDDPFYDGDLVGNLTQGMDAGAIFHGPCSIIAFDGYYYKDLRYGHSVFPNRVWTIMRYSENAIADDTDTSNGDLDIYAYDVDTGLYPALVYETLTDVNSHIIASGEAIYSNYKYMYDQRTENGVYNENHHFGEVLVNNIFNYFLETKVITTPTPTPTPTPTDTETTIVGFGITAALISLLSIGISTVFIIRKRY